MANEDCFRGIFDGGLVAMAILSRDGIVRSANHAFGSLLGYQAQDLIARHYGDLVESGHRDGVEAYFRSISIGNFTGHQHECQYLHKDGHSVYGLVALTTIRSGAGEVRGIVVQAQNVTEERDIKRQLVFQASHDELTGLVNRREFQRRLEHIAQSSSERGEQHVLCYIDLDHFKIVNDTFGHSVGDHMLKQIVTIMRGLFHSRDTLARIGGDEFGIILQDCGVSDATKTCAAFINTLSNTAFMWNGRTFHIRASIGLVPINSASPDPVELLKHADLACYSAKDRGGNRAVCFSSDEDDPAHGSDIIRAVQCMDALYDDRLCLYAQPIVPLREDGRTAPWYEILLRVVVNESEVMSPYLLIPAAERYGQMTSIDRWVIDKTMREYVTLSRNGDLCLSINLSGSSISSGELPGYIASKFDEYGVPAECICFELTETTAVQNVTQVLELMKMFKDQGCYFALDDFGSGLSSFKYLKQFPFDFLKIDGSLVEDITVDSTDAALVRAIGQLSQALGLRSIAEWISQADVARIATSLEIDYGQGFFYGRPIPIEDIGGSLKATNYQPVKATG